MPGRRRGFWIGLAAIPGVGFALRVAFVGFSRVQHLPLGLEAVGSA